MPATKTTKNQRRRPRRPAIGGGRYLLANLAVDPVTPQQERRAMQVVALNVPKPEVVFTLRQLGLVK